MARVESGDYTNTLTKEANNIFSMGYPTVRPSANIGSYVLDNAGPDEPKKFSKYKSYDQAIKDLLLWFDYNNFPKDIATLESFVHGLKDHGYFKINVDQYVKAMKGKL
ncbi:MAG: hypothetical protein RLO17_14640 [Cyclobacteriaceae bacterium]